MKPLVPEDITENSAHRRAFIRAVTAQTLSAVRRGSAASILSKNWPHDALAEKTLRMISRGAVSPLSTGDVPVLAVQAIRMLPRLAPRSAALRLFADCLAMDMTGGIATIRIPNVADIPPAQFIAEGEPAPLVEFAMSGATLGPVKKIVILSAVTRELEMASPDGATEIIGRLLGVSAEKGIDAVAFSTAAATDAAPAGLLHGVTPITATAGGGLGAMGDDLANIVDVISDAGLDASTMVLVASPAQSMTLALTAGPKFNFPVYSASVLPTGTIIAVVPDAVAVCYEGAPVVEVSTTVGVHYEDTTPLPIASPGAPATVAAPVRSAFQQDLLVLKLAARLAWTVAAPSGVQMISGTSW